MKKKLYILLISVLGLSIQSCSDYLDSDYIFRDRETIEKVFTDRDKTEAWLANAFSYLSDADRKSTRLNSSHIQKSRMPSSA